MNRQVRSKFWHVVAQLLLLAIAGQAIASQPATTTQHPICPARCVNGMAEVQQYLGNQCVAAYAVPCFPNACDPQGITCRVTQCMSDNDCGTGAVCNLANGHCAPIAYFCSDTFNIEETNGQVRSCAPYKCIAGGCRASCQQPGDCAQGYSCNAGRCVK
jgi:hypothetical protein